LKIVARASAGVGRRLFVLTPALATGLALFAIWEALTRLLNTPDWLLPPPSAIAVAFFVEFDLLIGEAVVTLSEILAGFAVAAALGAAFAIVAAWTKWFERGLYPLIIALQTLPILALAPLLIVWFGLGLTSKVVIVALISFFPIAVSLVDGLKSTDRDLVNMMRVSGASRFQIFVKLQCPSALPNLFIGLKLGVVSAVIGAVVAEWVGSGSGLGYLIKLKGPQFQTDLVFAAIIMLVALSGALFWAIKLIQNFALRHHEPKGVN